MNTKTQWNTLRPFEKRVVVGVAAALFIVFNLWFVVPHFSDYAHVGDRMFKAQKTLRLFDAELAQRSKYERLVRELESESLSVPAEEQALNFSTEILSRAGQVGITPGTSSRVQRQTNDIFVELSQTITTQSTEQQMVDFIYSLGSGNSLIRVRDLGMRPDPPRFALVSTIKLVASYQKKATSKTAAPATKAATASPAPAAAAPAAKPPAPKTNAPAFKPVAPTAKPGSITNKPGIIPAKKP